MSKCLLVRCLFSKFLKPFTVLNYVSCLSNKFLKPFTVSKLIISSVKLFHSRNVVSGEVTLVKLFYLLSEKGSTLKSKEFSPLGSELFIFRVDLFLEGKQEVTKVIPLLKCGRKNK